MKNNIIFLFIMLISLALSVESLAQDNTQERYVRIMLDSGNPLEGRVVDITETHFILDLGIMGEISVSKLEILHIENIDPSQMTREEVNERSRDVNPQSSRYFFSPSAHQLKQGEGYYHNVGVMYNSVSFGILDNLTAGITFTPIGMGATMKVGGKISDNFSMSAGAIAVMSFYPPDEWDENSFTWNYNDSFFRRLDGPIAIPFANFTVGSERRNFTFNYGFAMLDVSRPGENQWGEEYFRNKNSHMFNISSMIEINPRSWIMVEAYYIRQHNREVITVQESVPPPPIYPWGPDNFYTTGPSDQSTFLIGFRKATPNRALLWDFGINSIVWNDVFFPLPWVGITVPM